MLLLVHVTKTISCWLSKLKLNHTDDGVHLIMIYEDLSYIFTFDLEYV